MWVFTLFMADFFDTMGTLVGVGKAAGYVDDKGDFPEVRKPLLVDSLAAVAGGAASSSSATTYIESGSGVSAGGRTGWVAVVSGALFLPFMFFAPIIGMVPPEATAAALVIVGFLMVSVLTEAEGEAEGERRKLAGIDFSLLEIGLPAALIIMLMPFTFSITNGIGFGFIAYVIIRAAQGKARDVNPFMWIAAGAFALYFLVPLLQDNLAGSEGVGEPMVPPRAPSFCLSGFDSGLSVASRAGEPPSGPGAGSHCSGRAWSCGLRARTCGAGAPARNLLPEAHGVS